MQTTRSYTRTKMLTLDGAEFVIAPLTTRQVEVQINDRENPAGTTPEAIKQMAGYVYELVATGLDNGAKAIGSGEQWTKENVPEKLDTVVITWLQEEILTFSGLKVEKSSQGESGAATPTAA
ncbi:MAG TPA: hypothetical protein VN736_23210 [Candidatus Limnocylindrales bacterium]|nr:hypothetical protein [Candidatus Limnocylindrales bacterium]